MDTKFKAIMSAEEAKKKADEYLEEAYQLNERFLILYIANAIYEAASEGKTSCIVNTNQRCFPTNLTAKKVMEHLALPLNELGYRVEVSGDCHMEIYWKECEWESVPF